MVSCMRAYSTVQQLLCHGGCCELILSLARTLCRLLFTARPTARSLAALRDVVRSRNPSKSTLAHDAVATAVLHKHHPIIRFGAGLIQFVYRSHLRLATEATRNRIVFSPFFPASLYRPQYREHVGTRCTSVGERDRTSENATSREKAKALRRFCATARETETEIRAEREGQAESACLRLAHKRE